MSYAFIFATVLRDKLNTSMLCFLYVKQTNVLQSIVIHESFVCAFSCCIIVSWLLLELCLSCSCLEYLDPSYQCFYNNDDQDCVGCMSPIKLYCFYHLPTRGRAGVKLGDVDTLQMYP